MLSIAIAVCIMFFVIALTKVIKVFLSKFFDKADKLKSFDFFNLVNEFVKSIHKFYFYVFYLYFPLKYLKFPNMISVFIDSF